jgi:hypothetical protein
VRYEGGYREDRQILLPYQLRLSNLWSSVKADALTSRLRIGRPSETNSKEQQSMNAGEQTPTNLRQDQLTPMPTHKRRLPNAGGLCGSFPEGHFR